VLGRLFSISEARLTSVVVFFSYCLAVDGRLFGFLTSTGCLRPSLSASSLTSINDMTCGMLDVGLISLAFAEDSESLSCPAYLFRLWAAGGSEGLCLLLGYYFDWVMSRDSTTIDTTYSLLSRLS